MLSCMFLTDTIISPAEKESSLGLVEKVQWNVDLNLDLLHICPIKCPHACPVWINTGGRNHILARMGL